MLLYLFALDLQLKRAGRWKSSTVAEGYVDNSLTAKKQTSAILQGIANKENKELPQNVGFNAGAITLPQSNAGVADPNQEYYYTLRTCTEDKLDST